MPNVRRARFSGVRSEVFVPEAEPVEGAEHATEDGDKDHDIAFFDAEEDEDDELLEKPVEAEAATVPVSVAPPRARAGDPHGTFYRRALDVRPRPSNSTLIQGHCAVLPPFASRTG